MGDYWGQAVSISGLGKLRRERSCCAAFRQSRAIDRAGKRPFAPRDPAGFFTAAEGGRWRGG